MTHIAPVTETLKICAPASIPQACSLALSAPSNFKFEREDWTPPAQRRQQAELGQPADFPGSSRQVVPDLSAYATNRNRSLVRASTAPLWPNPFCGILIPSDMADGAGAMTKAGPRWTVRNVPPESRRRALSAAAAAGVAVGPWLAAAIAQAPTQTEAAPWIEASLAESGLPR